MKSGDYSEKSPASEKNPQGIFDGVRIIPFPARLKEAIGDESVRSFSRRCGLSEATLRDYLRGDSYPTLDRLSKIAISANTTIAWLIDVEVEKEISSDGKTNRHDDDSFSSEFALIPGYRVQVSAGHGAIAPEDERPCRYLAFRRRWLKWRGFSEKDLVIVWCKGDSMEPVISNNDTLVVHTGMTTPVDGGNYVLRNHDQLWVKRIQSMPNAWMLLSDNQQYLPIEVPKDEQHNFQIVGKVVHIAHDLD